MPSISCGNCEQTHGSVAEVRACYANPSVHATGKPKSPEQGRYFCRFVDSSWPTNAVCGFPVEISAGGDPVHVDRKLDGYHTPIAETIGQANRRAKGKPMKVNKTHVESVSEGFYQFDGQIFKVQRNLEGMRSYAKVLEADNSGEAGSWIYAPGAIHNLRAEHKLTKEQAAEFGKLYGVCCICARRLTNEESIAAGIGPICAGKQGW